MPYDKNNLAFQLKNVLEMSSKEIKQMITGKNVIYLYHNQIDAKGHELKTTKELVEATEKAIDEIFCEFLTVIDTFDRSEEAIKERGWDSEENTQKAIKRLLNAKKKALFVLEKYAVKPIVFEDNKAVDEWCITNGTEPDPTKENGEIITIEKEGYMRNEHVIRPAEVIVVKN